MSNLEHLIENGLVAMERCDGYDDWYAHMKDDPNWHTSWISIENLWTICQYVYYTWDIMRCDECHRFGCYGCKYVNSDKCDNCQRNWIDKTDLYESEPDAVREAFKQCEEFIENSTPEELQSYEDSLGINPDDYKSSSQDEWDRLWRYAERNRV